MRWLYSPSPWRHTSSMQLWMCSESTWLQFPRMNMVTMKISGYMMRTSQWTLTPKSWRLMLGCQVDKVWGRSGAHSTNELVASPVKLKNLFTLRLQQTRPGRPPSPDPRPDARTNKGDDCGLQRHHQNSNCQLCFFLMTISRLHESEQVDTSGWCLLKRNFGVVDNFAVASNCNCHGITNSNE